MSTPKKGPSSFIPYEEPKSADLYEFDLQLCEFSRLSLNSHKSGDVLSSCSNASRFASSIPEQILPKMSNVCGLSSRSRKNSAQLHWKNSIVNNGTFLNKSIQGKSSLCHHESFIFHDSEDHCNMKELSEKSCPVGSDETANINWEKEPKAYEEGQHIDATGIRQRLNKKFLKTKNLLRNLSSYLHKYIKFNPRCKRLVIKYFSKVTPLGDDLEAEQFYQAFVEWTSQYSLTNFQEYQKIWMSDSKFTSLYRQICLKYYTEDLFCDIHLSRLSSKEIILEYTPKFIMGLLDPKSFTHFQSE